MRIDRWNNPRAPLLRQPRSREMHIKAKIVVFQKSDGGTSDSITSAIGTHSFLVGVLQAYRRWPAAYQARHDDSSWLFLKYSQHPFAQQRPVIDRRGRPMPTETKSAEPLKVECSTVTKLVITGASRHDYRVSRGFRSPRLPTESDPSYQTALCKITINCWGQQLERLLRWHGPAQGGRVPSNCDWHYVLNCLDRGISSTRFSGNALQALAKKCIVQRRR